MLPEGGLCQCTIDEKAIRSNSNKLIEQIVVLTSSFKVGFIDQIFHDKFTKPLQSEIKSVLIMSEFSHRLI